MKIKICILTLFTTSIALSASPVAVKNESTEASALNDLYNLQIPDSEFLSINLDAAKGIRLPFEQYPQLNKRLAYKLISKNETPIKIVIQTEPPKDKLINELDQNVPKLRDEKHKKTLGNILSAAKERRANKRGVNTIYAAVNTPSGEQYKLLHVRFPGFRRGKDDNEAVVVAIPNGNLQLFENSGKEGEKQVVELATK